MANMYIEREMAHQVSVQRAREEILSLQEVEKMCKIFQVLSEPSRLKIVLALMKGEMCVYHLAGVCNATVSGVSHQLRIMRDNGIVHAKRFGKNVEYSIADAHVYEMVAMALEHLKCER
jgi:ArsR family transcriptional regulator